MKHVNQLSDSDFHRIWKFPDLNNLLTKGLGADMIVPILRTKMGNLVT